MATAAGVGTSTSTIGTPKLGNTAAIASRNTGAATNTITTTTAPAVARGSNSSKKHTLKSSRRNASVAGLSTSSTPNLHAAYSRPPPLPNGANSLSRKQSASILTSTATRSSLAPIFDDVEQAYSHNSPRTPSSNRNALKQSPASRANMALLPTTPAKSSEARITGAESPVAEEGDLVDVPGNMQGTVRFVGSVAGRKGTFAGVELHGDFASRGKNSGDVDGVSYFSTTIPGAGIFLPIQKAVRRESTTPTAGDHSMYPLTPHNGGLKLGNQNSVNFTPPTPSLPKFSQSVGPGRAPSPSGRRPRTSLPRPDSPQRRLPMTPAPRQSLAAPSAKAIPRYGSPAPNKFSKSVAGPAPGDPSKRNGLQKADRSMSMGPRSASALGHAAGGMNEDDMSRPPPKGSMPPPRPASPVKYRPVSRAASRMGNNNDGEVDRLRAEIADRDRQLKEQAATLLDMESSLTEVQNLMEQADGAGIQRGSMDGQDINQLRAILREKNDKIAMLTAEFDAHRADFRSTIDTLEMASTETERVYERKIEELTQELQDAHERTSDVDTVALQLKQLEELVQELEEGLEDARRGEAEARGEVEFLRGEVERTRTELRREREKAAATTNGGTSTSSKDLEQKEDEIRGLKAIIHSLSRDSLPSGDMDRPLLPRPNSLQKRNSQQGSPAGQGKLEREVAELRTLLNNKNEHEVQMERELETLRRASAHTIRGPSTNGDRSSFRDSRGTVVPAKENESQHTDSQREPVRKTHTRGITLDTMPESDGHSNATGDSGALWCELCETSGHDILSCTNVFGADAGADVKTPVPTPAALSRATNGVAATATATATATQHHRDESVAKPAPLSPIKEKMAIPTSNTNGTGNMSSTSPAVRIMPNPMDSGPVAGKETGTVDPAKWCALCERDGHDSVDCPFEDAFWKKCCAWGSWGSRS